jgi:hypothetical protein
MNAVGLDATDMLSGVIAVAFRRDCRAAGRDRHALL